MGKNNIKLSTNRLQQFGNEYQLEFVDVYYKNNRTKHLWKCKIHAKIYSVAFDKLQARKRLSCCVVPRTQVSIDNGRQIASKYNLIFHEDSFVHGQRNNLWSCKIHNQEFSASVFNLMHIGELKCPLCRDDARKSRLSTQLKNVLTAAPIVEFIEPEFLGMEISHKWRCIKHNFETTSRGNVIIKAGRLKCCRWEENRGTNHSQYNKDISDEYRVKNRYYQKSKAWSKEIRERDGYKCVLCNYDRRCVAHHLYSYLAHPELRYDLDNGVTLCRDCHNKFHKKYGRSKTTKEQFEEFKKQ